MKDREGAITVTRGFVDAVEEEVATILLGEERARVPTAILPDGVGEGRWIELRIKALPQPADAAATRGKRKKLSSDDDGGNFKL